MGTKKAKTSHVGKGVQKKSAKAKDAGKKEEEVSLWDRAKGEKGMSLTAYSGKEGKKYTRQLFKLWMSMPDTFKGAPERITALLGLTDPVALALLAIPTMQKFADEFGVIPQTLSRWRGELEDSSDFLKDVKKEMRRATRNILGALYRKTLEEADAPRVIAWMKIVEDWREQLGVEMTESVSSLTPEERKALDDLLRKNTKVMN